MRRLGGERLAGRKFADERAVGTFVSSSCRPYGAIWKRSRH
jgi:hypothetical protein